MKISPARSSAFDILKKIEVDRAFSSVLLPIYEAKLSNADARLCHEITLGVLRRRMYLDALIDALAANKKLDLDVRIALRIGLYQLDFLSKIPAHSAVDESVSLVARAKKTSAKSFVNAILRNFTRKHPRLNFLDEIEMLAVTQSHPRWLIEKWIEDWGGESASRMATANNEPPSTGFRLLGDSDETSKLVRSSRASEHVTGCWIADGPNPLVRKLSDEGLIYVQDEGSQMVADLVDIEPNGRFLDVCAAPGGKTGVVAEKFHNEDVGLIIAGDFYENRVKHLRENCERQAPGKISVVRYDAVSALPFAEKTFDHVLVDAPCSGTGTIRHNPEIRYFLNENDFYDLQRKQLAILENASKLVVDGGGLTYSTCSFEPEENEAVALEFLDRNAKFEQVFPEISPELVTEDGVVRTFPHEDGMDGFFVAQFMR